MRTLENFLPEAVRATRQLPRRRLSQWESLSLAHQHVRRFPGGGPLGSPWTPRAVASSSSSSSNSHAMTFATRTRNRKSRHVTSRHVKMSPSILTRGDYYSRGRVVSVPVPRLSFAILSVVIGYTGWHEKVSHL